MRNLFGKSMLASACCLGLLFSASGAKLVETVKQADLGVAWGNAKANRTADGSIRVEALTADGPAALNAGNKVEIAPGDEFTVSFEARGNVKFLVMMNFPESSVKRIDLLPMTQLNPDKWESFTRSYRMPDGCSKLTLDFLVWQQTGFFEIRNYRLMAPAKKPDTMVVDEYFRKGEFRNNVFSATVPAGWTRFRSGTEPDADCGGITKEFTLVSPQFHSLAVPVPAKGEVGWSNAATPVYRPLRPWNILVQYRPSDDFSGGEPVCRITFYDKDGKPLPKPVEYLLPVKKNAGWNTAKHELPTSAFPADAESFRVTLAVKRGGGTPAGKLFFGLVRIKLPVTAGTFAKVRGSEFANWFTPGLPVVFKPEGVMPPDALSVTGKVTNEQNELLDTVTVSAAEFEKNGWKYEPKEPGLYYVEFEAKTPNGSISLGEEYMERAMDNRIGLYEQKRQAFAVIPPRRSDGTATPPVFGYQVGYSPNSTRGETEVELIRRAGADFARFHVTWFEIEPEKGKFDWAGLDRLVDKCVKAGIKPVICFYGTPRWASNTPDDTRYVVHVWAYNAYAAKDVNDWTNFVGQLVKRYGDRVDTWEVWNEPHLRNYSCYWHDTPENYVMLLKSAYQTIKKLQPESKVWIGGMALRYLPFYEAIMKLGAGPYFDYFAMHGHGQSIAPFHALDRKYGSEPHPWVSSEWHASLIRYTDAAYKLNENQRTVRMMLDFFSMVRQGAEQIAFFEPFNLVERETLKLHTEGGAPLNHCSGIFRRRPYFQPVLGAVVMATFDRALAGKIGITGTYRFGNQKAAAFTSDYGPLLVVWQETDRDEKLAPELAPVFAKANVQSWEGRPVKEPGSMTLRPHTMYFASNVTIPPEWQDRPDVLRADRPKLELEHKVRGVYGDKPLFDDNGKLIAKNVRWNNRGFKIHTMPGFEPFRKDARFAAALFGDRLQLVVETQDDLFHQPGAGGNMWQGDGIEFAFDAVGDGYADSRVEFLASKTAKGDELFKSANPTLVGDLPTEWTTPNTTVKYGKAKVETLPGRKTRYLVEMSISELYPLVPKTGDDLRFSLIVNESDGKNRIGLAHWASGIFNGKKPAEYGDLVPAGK